MTIRDSGNTGSSPDLRKIVRQVRRNVIAQSALQEALAGCKHLLQVGPDCEAYLIISAGIGVTYMRPFLEADGIGRLDPKKFEAFPGRPDLQSLHEDLREGRHNIDAHYSPSGAAKLLQCPVQRKEQERLRFIRKGGAWHVQPPTIGWHVKRIPALMELIQFQIERLLDEMQAWLTLLEQGRDWPDGLYHLGEDFP